MIKHLRTASRILLALIVIGLASCDNSSGPSGGTSVIIPLTVGNTWIGEVTITDTSGGILARTPDTLRVPGDTTIAGEKWYRSDDRSYLANRNDGAYEWINPSSASNQPMLLFKYPGKAGDTYQGRVEVSPGVFQNVNMQVVETNASISADGKSYTCYHYKQTGVTTPFGSELHYYLEPNGGWVRMDGVTRRSNGSDVTVYVWQLKQRVLK